MKPHNIFPTCESLPMTVQGGKIAADIIKHKNELQKNRINVITILHHVESDTAEILTTTHDPGSIAAALHLASTSFLDMWQEEKINSN